MQTTTRAKLFLKRHAPAPLFKVIRFVADKTILKVLLFFFQIRTTNFRRSYFKEVFLDNNTPFQIEINPENGYLDAQIHAHGLYEPHIIETMKKYVHPGNVCLDIGANIGHHTIALSRLVGRDGHVYAYEPIPYVRDQMARSLAVNSIHNVTIHDVALSDNEGEMVLHMRKGNIGGSSFVSGEDTTELPVRVTTLDREHSGKVDFLKIDVEGFEYHVLIGGKELIERCRPVVIFEWSPAYYRIHDESHMKLILQFFKERNYRLVDIENDNKLITHLDEFISGFDEGLRSQTNILALPI